MSLRINLREYRILPDVAADLIERVWGMGLTYREARSIFASRLEAFPRSAMRSDSNAGILVSTAVSGQALDRLVERFWPFISPADLVRLTFSGRRSLRASADGIFDPSEQALLVRKTADRVTKEVWAPGDAPLLDEAQALIAGSPRTYGHVVVDEAQDLSPMQLRMVARRAPTGSLTLLGDVAQGHGALGHTSWETVLGGLPNGDEARIESLGCAYRTPAPIMSIAAKLLQLIAPEATFPVAVRPGEAPRYVRVEPSQLSVGTIGAIQRARGSGAPSASSCPRSCMTRRSPWRRIPGSSSIQRRLPVAAGSPS